MDSTGRVLIVDGDRAAAARMRELLAPDGYAVETVFTGDACLSAVSQTPPDVLVLDLALPDRPGFDVLRKIHKHYPELGIVVTMAQVTANDVVAAMKAGAADVLPKPPDAGRLSVAVRDAWQEAVTRGEVDRLSVETGEGLQTVKLDDILNELVMNSGSDLHLKVGRPPLFRIAGDLAPSSLPELTEADMKGILQQLLGRAGFRELEDNFESDTSYLLPGMARFRVNAFKRMGQFGAAFRLIPLVTPTIEMMKLPGVLKEICKAPQGLVLLTGPTGSGKSTTLAAMIDHLNDTQPLHIVTIEDPVEFVYTDKKCTINQRQLGNDVKSLHEALRRVLRQDPDVILMGEMRDRETMELAMHAAETGHLVFSTLHTNDTKQTLDRIIDAFPPDAHHQVRAQLALTLQAVVGQRLIRRADGQGRVAAVEVMINSPNIRELIAEGKTSSIEKAIAASSDYYSMQTFNQSLAKLAMSGVVTQEEALASSMTPGDLRLMFKGVQSGSSSTAIVDAKTMKAAFDAAKNPPPPAAPGEAQRLKISRGF
jgi:twitching motility protein PilT